MYAVEKFDYTEFPHPTTNLRSLPPAVWAFMARVLLIFNVSIGINFRPNGDILIEVRRRQKQTFTFPTIGISFGDLITFRTLREI